MLGGYDGSIRIKANLDHSGFDRGLSSMTGSLKRFTSTLSKLAGMVGLAFGVGALINFGKESIRLASDIQEVQNVIDVTFGKGAAQIEAFAQSAAEAFGLSELSAKQYTGTMGAMLKSSGLATRQAQEMSITLAGLTGDLASFYNLKTDEAFEKIRSGISGETEPLRQLGINMSVANLEAYALTKGITKSYNAMSQAEQVLLRYNYLLSVTTDAQGDFARTSGSLANQVRILQLNFDQLRIAVGNALIPIAQAVLPGINAIISALTKLARVFAKVSALLFGKPQAGSSGQVEAQEEIAVSGGAAADSSDKLAGSLGATGEAAKKAGKDMKGVLAGFDELNVLADGAASSLEGAAGGMDTGMEDIALPEVEEGDLFDGVEISPQLVAEVDAFRESIGRIWDVFRESWEKNGPGVLEAAHGALSSLYELLKSIGRAFTEAFTGGAGAEWLQSIYDELQGVLEIISAIAEAFRTAFDNSGTELIESILFKSTEVRNMWNSIRDAFLEAWNSGLGVEICEHILAIVTNINNTVGTLAQKFREAWEANENGEAIWSSILGIVESVLGTVERLTESTLAWAQGLDLEPLVTAFRGLLEALEPLVDLILDGLAYAYENVLLPLGSWAAEELAPVALDLLAAAVGTLTEVLEALSPLGTWLWENFLQPLASWTGDVVIGALETVTDLLNRFSEWVSENESLVQDIAIVVGSFAAAWVLVNTAVSAWELISMAAATATTVLGSAVAFLASPIGVITIAIGAVIAIVVLLIKHWDEVKEAGAKAWEFIQGAWNSAAEWFNKNVIEPVVSFFSNLFGNIRAAATDARDKVKEVWNVVAGWFSQNVTGPIGKFFSDTWSGTTKAASDAWANIKKGVQDFWDGIKRWWNENVAKYFSFDFWKDLGKNMIDGLLGGLNDIFSGIGKWASDLWSDITGVFSKNNARVSVSNSARRSRSALTSGQEAVIASVQDYSAARLPRLANGAVIPPNHQFAAILGDQRSGMNVEAPADLIRQMVAEGMQAVLASGGFGRGGNMTVVMEIDGREFGRASYKYGTAERQRVGVRLTEVRT